MAGETTVQRLFFALHADGVREPLSEVYRRLNAFPSALKAVLPDNYHITLKFLGATAPDLCKKISADFNNLAIGAPPIRFELAELGGFPNRRNARVIWCGIRADGAAINAIHACIEDLCEKHGFKKEDRAFTPHFTLARTRKDKKLPLELAQYLADNAGTCFGSAQFDKIVLYKSEPGKNGPVYTGLEEIRLCV